MRPPTEASEEVTRIIPQLESDIPYEELRPDGASTTPATQSSRSPTMWLRMLALFLISCSMMSAVRLIRRCASQMAVMVITHQRGKAHSQP